MKTKKNHVRHISFRVPSDDYDRIKNVLAHNHYAGSVSDSAKKILMEWVAGEHSPTSELCEAREEVTYYQGLAMQLTSRCEAFERELDEAKRQRNEYQQSAIQMAKERRQAAAIISRQLASAESQARTWRLGFALVSLMFVALAAIALHHEATRYKAPSQQPPSMKPVLVVTDGYQENGKWKSLDDGREITVRGWMKKN